MKFSLAVCTVLRYRILFILVAAFFATTLSSNSVQAEHEGKVQILLLGDSTTEGSVPRRHAPRGPHLEDVIRELLAAEKDLPPTNVINLGLSGEFIRRLLDSGRYEKAASKLPGIDYVLIRYGLNDNARREHFAENFPKDYHELIGRLKTDHPQATLIVMTVIPYGDEATSLRLNKLNEEVTKAEGLAYRTANLRLDRASLSRTNRPLERFLLRVRAASATAIAARADFPSAWPLVWEQTHRRSAASLWGNSIIRTRTHCS